MSNRNGILNRYLKRLEKTFRSTSYAYRVFMLQTFYTIKTLGKHIVLIKAIYHSENRLTKCKYTDREISKLYFIFQISQQDIIHFCFKSDFCTALSGIFHSIALFEFILLSMWVIFKHLIVAHLFDGNTITYNIKNYGKRIYVFGIWIIGQYAPGLVYQD